MATATASSSACGRARLCDVNPHLTCVLCGGYYVDATTICECLHSFCKSCIVKHLETSKFCPICDVQLHKTKPLLSIRPDKTLQRLVYKVVPGLYRREADRRRQFYGDDHLDQEQEQDRMTPQQQFYSPDESISLSLEYYDSSRFEEKSEDVANKGDDNNEEVQRRYLQCPAGVNVHHLKKFLRMKYGLRCDHRVDIYYQTKLLPDLFTLIDVAYSFNWDRAHPMRFGFQILERHTVTVTSKNHVMVAESSPSSSMLMETVVTRSQSGEDGVRSERDNAREVGSKKKLDEDSQDESPAKKSCYVSVIQMTRQTADSNCGASETAEKELVKAVIRVQPLTECVTIEDSNDAEVAKEEKGGETKVASPVVNDIEMEEGCQEAKLVVEETPKDATRDADEVIVDVDGEPSQDFILQEEQANDISEDLEEDDDEDRLRICDPEEIPEERNSDIVEEPMETEVTKEPEVEEKLEKCIEEEAEVFKKEKSRKKNKKAKHHHRHKRDYSPAPEATIVSDDKNDIMKLKVKITRTDSESNGKRFKQDEGSKHYRSGDGHSSPRQSKHRSSSSPEMNPLQSPSSTSNVDEDSRHSQSTDDHDVRSVASSKEGVDEQSQNGKGGPVPNGNVDSSKLSAKEKLTQMRQVRHKNITPPPTTTTTTGTTISKVSAEEANKNNPILLTTSSSSLTVSKVTAEERMKMMTNNNLESKRPSLEIIMVNNPNATSKPNDGNKLNESQLKQRTLSGPNPVVRLTKTNNLTSLMQKQHALSVSKVKSGSDIAGKKVESLNSVMGEQKNGRPGEKKESFGVLDLSGKSTRSTGSSPVLEDSPNRQSPNQTALSMAQPLLNRHLVAMNSNSNSPPVKASVPKVSPNRMQHMWNLGMLSETAVQLRNIQAQDGLKQRQMMPQQKKPQQRFPVMPTLRTAQLKIPQPSINKQLINFRPKLPVNSNLGNRMRPAGIIKPMTNAGAAVRAPTAPVRPTTSFPNMMQSQSAAVAKKQAGINGRASIPPPPPAIPISSLYSLESMSKKYDLEKIARGLSAASKAKAGIPSS